MTTGTLDAKSFVSEAVKLIVEIDSHNEVLKQLKADAKEAGLDVAALSAVAKAIAFNRVSELQEKSEALLEAIEEYRS